MVPVQHGKLKLPEHPNSLPKLIRNVFAQCHGSCHRSPSILSSVDEIFDSNLSHNYKELIMLELQARAIRAKSRKPQELFTGRLTWAVSPTTGRVRVASALRDIDVAENRQDNHEEYKEEEEEISSEAFFSMKSCFSCCSVELGSSFCTELKDYDWGRTLPSIWEEFRGCQGWPFGLCRRAVVLLPPLPNSPSDSWTWHKKNLATKIIATTVRTAN